MRKNMMPREKKGFLKPKDVLVGNEDKEDCTNNSAHYVILFFKLKCTGREGLQLPSPEKIYNRKTLN